VRAIGDFLRHTPAAGDIVRNWVEGGAFSIFPHKTFVGKILQHKNQLRTRSPAKRSRWVYEGSECEEKLEVALGPTVYYRVLQRMLCAAVCAGRPPREVASVV
jgi:hypothetical protein